MVAARAALRGGPEYNPFLLYAGKSQAVDNLITIPSAWRPSQPVKQGRR